MQKEGGAVAPAPKLARDASYSRSVVALLVLHTTTPFYVAPEQQPDALFGNAFKSSYVLCMYLIQGVSHITAFYSLQLCANALNSRLASYPASTCIKVKKIKHFTTKNRTRQRRSNEVINLCQKTELSFGILSGSISNFPNSTIAKIIFANTSRKLLVPACLLACTFHFVASISSKVQ